MNYYNEIDDKAAAWLRELVSQKLIPAGDVDTRSITEVKAHELKGYTQCHFFAGIGGWPLALQLAGWPADRPVWTGSCPCQPFSTAGKRLAQKDERHLWPVFFDLIRQCRPSVVFGEQVASSAVVGPSNPPRHLQNLRDQQTVLRILQELKGRETGNLQGVRQSAGALKKAVEAFRDSVWVQEMAGREEGSRSCERGEEPSEESGDTFQHQRGGRAGKNRRRSVRSDRNTIRPKNSASLECSVASPNGAESGVHPREYESGSLCSERNGEHLGIAEDCGGVEGDTEHETRSIEQIIGEVGSLSPEEAVRCWLDGVSADLEAEGYVCGAVVLGAHSVNSPHQRQRLYWVANDRSRRREMAHLDNGSGCAASSERETGILGVRGPSDGMADAGYRQRGWQSEQQSGCQMPTKRSQATANSQRCGAADRLDNTRRPSHERRGDAGDVGCPTGQEQGETRQRERGGHADSDSMQDHRGLVLSDRNGCGQGSLATESARYGSAPDTADFWSNHQLVHCRDGKTRRVPTEPAFFPLANGLPARVVRLRGYGNAIVPQVAAEFVKAYLDIGSSCGCRIEPANDPPGFWK